MHLGVEVTGSSTNKQHHLSLVVAALRGRGRVSHPKSTARCPPGLTHPSIRRGPGWRIHGSVEDTKLSTNKQHSLSHPLVRPHLPPCLRDKFRSVSLVLSRVSPSPAAQTPLETQIKSRALQTAFFPKSWIYCGSSDGDGVCGSDTAY